MSTYYSYPTGGAIDGTEIIGPVRQRGRDVTLALANITGASGAASANNVAFYGAKGDGVTDDTAAIQAAFNSGLPVQFAAATYLVNGNITVTASALMAFGVIGSTTIRRTATPPGADAWIKVTSAYARIEGIIFDANAAVASAQPAVQFPATVTAIGLFKCGFVNARGVQGWGVLINGAPSGTPLYNVEGCSFSNNAQDGIWLQNVWNAEIIGCTATSNGGNGILLNTSGATSGTLARRVVIANNRLGINTGCGLSVGNYNTASSGAPVWGPTAPQVQQVVISGNLVWENAGAAQVLADNDYMLVIGNQITRVTGSVAGAGINANCRYSRITGNMLLTTNCGWGIDTGGSTDCDVTNNTISGGVAGINPGGSLRTLVEGNTILGQTYAGISLYAVEDDGNGGGDGHAFPYLTNNITIRANRITVGGGGAKGIVARDAPLGVVIEGNDFYDNGSGGDGYALDVYAAATVRGNRWNGSSRFDTNPYGGNNIVQVADVYDAVRITGTNVTVGQLIPVTALNSRTAKQISWLNITNGGSGYTHATFSISDGAGSGANFNAYVYGGKVIGARLVNAGTNYVSPTVTVSGDGAGATATAQVGVPIYPDRTIDLTVQNGATITRTGTLGISQTNTTTADLVSPLQSTLRFRESFGTWVVK